MKHPIRPKHIKKIIEGCAFLVRPFGVYISCPEGTVFLHVSDHPKGELEVVKPGAIVKAETYREPEPGIFVARFIAVVKEPT